MSLKQYACIWTLRDTYSWDSTDYTLLYMKEVDLPHLSNELKVERVFVKGGGWSHEKRPNNATLYIPLTVSHDNSSRHQWWRKLSTPYSCSWPKSIEKPVSHRLELQLQPAGHHCKEEGYWWLNLHSSTARDSRNRATIAKALLQCPLFTLAIAYIPLKPVMVYWMTRFVGLNAYTCCHSNRNCPSWVNTITSSVDHMSINWNLVLLATDIYFFPKFTTELTQLSNLELIEFQSPYD